MALASQRVETPHSRSSPAGFWQVLPPCVNTIEPQDLVLVKEPVHCRRGHGSRARNAAVGMVLAAADAPKSTQTRSSTSWDLLWHQMIADCQKL